MRRMRTELHTRTPEIRSEARVREERAARLADREDRGAPWCDECWSRHAPGDCDAPSSWPDTTDPED